MSQIWEGAEPPEPTSISVAGWGRAVLRGLAIIVTIAAGLLVLIPLRLIERPIHGMFRPWTPHVTRVVCRVSLVWMGLRYERQGTVMRGRGAIVANHSSWLDIFTLNAGDCIHFVSKAEVSAWPGIGFLARATGTLFIARDRKEARVQTELFKTRLMAGQRLLFFPEGTSTDGLRVLPFKSTLFEAFFAQDLRKVLSVQPVSITYTAPENAEPRTYGWWGEMEFGPHLLHTLALPRQGRVVVVYHAPIPVAQMSDRKALAAACEATVRDGHGLT